MTKYTLEIKGDGLIGRMNFDLTPGHARSIWKPILVRSEGC